MGSRGRQAPTAGAVANNKPSKHSQEFKRPQHQAILAGQRIGLLISSSDNLESFGTSHSSNSAVDNNISYIHQANQTKNSNNQTPQVKYISNDGAIFRLASNLSHQPDNQLNRQQQQQQKQRNSFRFELNKRQQASLETLGNSPKSSSFESNQREDIASQGQQKLAIGRVVEGIWASGQQVGSQVSSAEKHQLLMRKFKQEAERKNLTATHQQHRQLDVKSAKVVLMNNKQLVNMNNQHSDQTYDSLTPDSFGNCKHNHNHHHHHQHQPDDPQINRQQQQQQQQICGAIPEEACDNGDYTNEEDEEMEEAELLLPERQLLRPKLQRVAARVETAVDRKSQLDNLHYATVTAAALLNATANAAAAIAATEKQFSRINQPSIYSDHYHEIRKQQKQQQRPGGLQQQLANSSVNKYRPAPSVRQPLPPIYADAYEQAGSVLASKPVPVERKPPGSTSALYGLHPSNRSHASRINQIYNLRNQQTDPMHQHLLTGQQDQSANAARFVDRNHAELVRQHHEHQRYLNQQQHHQNQQQHHQQQQQALVQLRNQAYLGHKQQQQQQQQPPSSALAIVHPGSGKNNSAKADLIGRMLMNNLLAAQQRLAGSTGGSPAEHYAVGGAALAADRNRFMLANNQKFLHGNHQTNELLNRQLNFGLHASNQLRDKSIYAAPRPIFAISGNPTAGIAPSDSSGSSNVPLVLKRRASFIDRICRIDLTLFWWSLLIVSLFFMSIVIAISRYIF